jgi:hypothetical protein
MQKLAASGAKNIGRAGSQRPGSRKLFHFEHLMIFKEKETNHVTFPLVAHLKREHQL